MKQKIRIGKLAQDVGVEKFVIRFWEKEFGFRPRRSEGGQRYYTQKDVEHFLNIKKLLYEEKYTIDGAKNILKQNTNNVSQKIVPARQDAQSKKISTITEQLKVLKSKLIKLNKQL